MTSPDKPETPTARPYDAERARLRAAGLTDDEISKIFVARELAGPAQQAGTGVSAGAAGHGMMSGALANLNAVLAHVRGAIPALAQQILTVRDRSATGTARLAALLSLSVKIGLIFVLGYAVYQEWHQHIVSATEIATAEAEKAHAEACSARLKMVIDITPMNELGTSTDQVQRDCDPNYAARAKACDDQFKVLFDEIEHVNAQDAEASKSIMGKIQEHKSNCVITSEQQKQLQGFADKVNARAAEAKKALAVIDLLQIDINAQKEFEAKHFAKAYQLEQDYVAKVETSLLKVGDRSAADLLGNPYVGLSFYALFVQKFDDALAASDQALKKQPGDLAALTNRAHALMFLGRAADAKTIYLGHKGEKLGKQTWEQVIAEDFAKLRKAGVTNPMMDEIEATLGVTEPVIASPAPAPPSSDQPPAAGASPTPALVPAAQPVSPAAPPAPDMSQAFQDGVAARAKWEDFIASLSGDALDGAKWWASVRSVKTEHHTCDEGRGADSADYRNACSQARDMLALIDVRRRSELDYKQGFNTAPAPHAQAESVTPQPD